jgi:crotonobetainyl-CoA:carnitine CoA-transferase CaiB-like acyl-CoA transferase
MASASAQREPPPEGAFRDLLAALGLPAAAPAAEDADGVHPDLAWARSGAMALTGEAQGPPRLAPAPLAARAARLCRALAELSGASALAQLDGAALLGERAACHGLMRRGRSAPGGGCRLLRAADGWLALSLARPDDQACLSAWLGDEGSGEAWRRAERGVAARGLGELVERARLLGLPAAPAGPPPPAPPPWVRACALGEPDPRAAARRARPRVVDLSALWAGPLCAQLLAEAGACVVKVESASRPDGARGGDARFFDLLNAGKRSAALDFAAPAGRAALRRLVARAEVVVESARPRALRQLGIEAEAWLAERPGRVWLSITGYGRSEPEAGWVAFGDDAAAAAGLAFATGAPGAPLFCGDAVADPLAGLHGAVAVLAALRCGGGLLLDVSLCDGVAHLLSGAHGVREACVEATAQGWEAALGRERAAVAPPRARRPRARARPLGADSAAVLGEAC